MTTKLLGVAVAALLVISVGAFLLPLFSSLTPNSVARERHVVRVPLSDLPTGSFVEVSWFDQRVFITDAHKPLVFGVPFSDGAYGLPDLTWDRAYIRCKTFGPIDGQFQCTDPDTPEWWRTNARWGLNGAPANPQFPALPVVPHRVIERSLIIGAGDA